MNATADYLTVSQVAALLGCETTYVRADIRAGRLPAEKVGSQWLIRRDHATAWMQNPRRGSRQQR